MAIRFSIRDVLWLTALIAVLVAWWMDHAKQIDKKYEAVQEAWGGIEAHETSWHAITDRQESIINGMENRLKAYEGQQSQGESTKK